MSARAVLNAAYTVLARKADERDRTIQMFGGKDEDGAELEPTARADLDAALGLTEDGAIDGAGDAVGDESSTTNVVELHAWVARVNRTMR